jgi:hypothetical protein
MRWRFARLRSVITADPAGRLEDCACALLESLIVQASTG